ncbi:MAG: ATP-binding protein [Acidobacteria bacterium]|nr:MAG: ATP-binding protein [Acidobacteriota bacterium]
MENFEKLGAFYLGRLYDPESRRPTDELLLYDAKDLTTHAVCAGMTGSGKTGLGVTLLEEAAIDGIPAIAIDPKGDLPNLLLTFPRLAPDDFRPWIDEGEALRRGMTPEAYARQVAAAWRDGLAAWGQSGERIERLRRSVDMAVYTPGSEAGLPLSVLRSLAAPPAALLADRDAVRERIQAAVSGLLSLLGLPDDPVKSREHILLSNIVDRAWRSRRDLALSDLIRAIQAPPFDRVGVLGIDEFYPADRRRELAMTLNNLLASPGFEAWTRGEPLDVGRLLFTGEGKPRLTILSIAHLGDAERMFFVTLLLNEVVAWMRSQPGTSSLRAVLYMDEVFGYFPPVAEPPSKRPMLTLLKQARAYGIGVVLATQNPADLDYKGLANAGTWFLGRLQTERDKRRVLDGLEGVAAASGGFDRQRVDHLLSGLDSRVFLMHNVHDDEPVLFHTRWALSYLRGPLTREQIRTLVGPAAAEPPPPAPPEEVPESAAERPALPPEIEELFLPASGQPDRVYRPGLYAEARLHFVRASLGIDEWREVVVAVSLPERPGPDPWNGARTAAPGDLAPGSDPGVGARFVPPPRDALDPRNYGRWRRALSSHLYRESALQIFRCRPLGALSRPGEAEGEFRARLSLLAREARDREMGKLRRRYGPRLARLKERIRRAELRVEREKSQLGQHRLQAAVALGATVLGALFGRKAASVGTVGRAGTAVRSAGRMIRERTDVSRAEEAVALVREELERLEAEFEERAAALRERFDPERLPVERIAVRPRKSDIAIERVAFCWIPA